MTALNHVGEQVRVMAGSVSHLATKFSLQSTDLSAVVSRLDFLESQQAYMMNGLQALPGWPAHLDVPIANPQREEINTTPRPQSPPPDLPSVTSFSTWQPHCCNTYEEFVSQEEKLQQNACLLRELVARYGLHKEAGAKE